jgi:hypothetical protein
MGKTEPKKQSTSIPTKEEVTALFVFDEGKLQNGFGREGRASVTLALLAFLKSVDTPRVYVDSSFSVNGFGAPRFFVETLTADIDSAGRSLEEAFYGGEGVIVSPHLGIILAAHRRTDKLVFAYQGRMPTWSDLYAPYQEGVIVPEKSALEVASKIPLAHPDAKLKATDGWKFLTAVIV